MKRPPSIPELSGTPRRKRHLSEEERALWESVARQTKPLRKKPRAAKTETAPHDPQRGVAEKRCRVAKTTHPASTFEGDEARRAAAGAARTPRAFAIVARAERDRSPARSAWHDADPRARALSGFLHRAHLDGLTFVLVITGKGKMGAESERGVLRRQVPQWLSQPEFRTLVVGFEEAHIGHGGEGALYVRIRRSRIQLAVAPPGFSQATTRGLASSS